MSRRKRTLSLYEINENLTFDDQFRNIQTLTLCGKLS
jgi:hypothetical protein